MSYLQNAFGSLLETFIGLYAIAVILRFLFQLLRVDFRNPLVHAVVVVTNPPLRILRRFVPGLYGIDLASVLLILVLCLCKLMVRLAILGYSFESFSWSGALVVSLADSLNAVVWIFIIAVLARVVVSWVAPRSLHPAVRVLDGLSEPVTTPFRRILPAVAGLDFSPILSLLALQLVQKLVLTPLTDWGLGLL